MTDQSHDHDQELDPAMAELRIWARAAIETLAVKAQQEEEQDVDLAQDQDDRAVIEQLSDDHHDALATIAVESLVDEDPHVRWAAVWCLGEVRSYLEETPDLLVECLWNDPETFVRSGAAWALGNFEDESETIVPELILALDDADPTVRVGAIDSLMRLGPLAITATSTLVRIATAQDHPQRLLAVRALAEINPDDPSVKSVLRNSLVAQDEACDFAAYGVGRSESPQADVAQPLIALLQADLSSTVVAAWALKRIGQPAGVSVSQLLHALARPNWLEVEDARISIRPDLREALAAVIEPTADETYREFRLRFFDFAFRDDHEAVAGQAEELARLDFYWKIQRERFPATRGESDRQFIEQFMQQAQQKFAQRLRNRPTLTLHAERYAELPGLIEDVTRTIAFNLWRSLYRARARAQQQRAHSTTFSLPDHAEGRELVHLVFMENRAGLTEDERYVAGLKILGRNSIPAIAKMLNLSVSQVKTRWNKATSKIRRWLNDHA